jgi:hypothetical protein
VNVRIEILPWLLKGEWYLPLLLTLLLCELIERELFTIEHIFRFVCVLNIQPATNNTAGASGLGTNNFPVLVQNGEGASNSHSTTTFITDANVVTGTVNKQTRVSDKFVSSNSTGFSQDIVSFLQKPMELLSGSLSATDTVSTFAKIPLPSTALQNTLFQAKISGFLGFKADMRIKIIINGSRFQQGRYKLTWTPIGGAPSGGAHALAWWDAHNSTLIQRSQLQGIEMDVNCDTEGDMLIPFSSFLNFFPLACKTANIATYYGDTGYLHLYAYTALESIATPITAPFKIMLSFENVQLITPAAPQMGRVSRGNRSKSLGESEKDSQGVGPLSGPLLSISNASSALTSIPLLSDYAHGLSWVTEIIGNAAMAFGWSKPNNNMATTRNLPQIAPYLGNVDAVDQSLPLAFSVKNEINNLEGFSGTDVDELSFAYLATIPAFFQRLDWTNALVSGSTLVTWDLRPNVFYGVRTVNAQVLKDYCPCAYVADHFELWRGSFIFTFKLVKTEFHSGRLMVAYYPRANINATTDTISYDNSHYTHREIIDVRMCNEFTLRIPYASVVPFTKKDSTIGSVRVYVFDQLVAPDNVMSSIDILCEVSMGDDCEFAVPALHQMSPVLNITPQMANVDTPDDVCEIVSETIGNARVTSDSLLSAQSCIGESMLSFRSILKMFEAMSRMVLTVEPTGVWLAIYPYNVTYMWNQVGSTPPAFLPTLYDELNSIFLYSRGGARFKIVNPSPILGLRPLLATMTYAGPQSGVPLVYSSGPDGYDSAVHSQGKPLALVSNTNAVVEVQVPQYLSTHSRNNILSMAAGTAMSPNTTGPNYTGRVLVTTPGQTTVNSWHIYRSVADDYNMGCFVSIPPFRPNLVTDWANYVRTI